MGQPLEDGNRDGNTDDADDEHDEHGAEDALLLGPLPDGFDELPPEIIALCDR